jgi:hypothetical protein
LPDKAVATIWINVHLQSQESKFAKIHGKWLMQNSSICVHTTSIIIFHKKKITKVYSFHNILHDLMPSS